MDAINISLSAYDPKNIFPQNFSFPSSIIYYIKNNNISNPNGHLKAIKSCKYFYSKKKFIVPFYNTEGHICEETGKKFFLTTIYNKQNITVFLDDITFNVWLTGNFFIYYKNLTCNLVNNIKKSNISFLALIDDVIVLDDLNVLTQNIKAFQLWNTVVKYKDNKIVPIDCLFASLPDDILEFDYLRPIEHTEIFTRKSLKNVAEMVRFSKLEHFCLRRAHQNFEVEPFLKLMQEHPISYLFDFRGPLPENKIEEVRSFVKKIIENGVTENPVPLIIYSNQTEEEENMLDKMVNTYYEKNKSAIKS